MVCGVRICGGVCLCGVVVVVVVEFVSWNGNGNPFCASLWFHAPINILSHQQQIKATAREPERERERERVVQFPGLSRPQPSAPSSS